MYINKIGGEIKFTAEKVLSDWSSYLLFRNFKNLYNKSYFCAKRGSESAVY